MPSAQSSLLPLLDQKLLVAKDEFSQKHAFAQKWLENKGLNLNQLREHSTRLLAGTAISGALLLSAPHLPFLSKHPSAKIRQYSNPQDLLNAIKFMFNQKLNEETELMVTDNLKKYYGVSTAFQLDNNRLPAYYGKMGLEQHLVRYVSDTIDKHGNFSEAGMAPGRGAFGYFFDGSSWETAEKNEEYYIVLQTFLIPNWNQDWGYLKDWYKYRKFLVVNTATGQAVVAALGDSGPAVSTGRVFGGSPEVMSSLGFYPGKHEGEVLVLYLDDPGNLVLLGPVNIKN